MKTNKKTRIFEIAVCLVAIVATVLVFRHYTQRRDKLIAEWYPTQTYGFSTKYEFGEGSVWLSDEELQSYQAKTDVYNSGVCYNLLSSEEKIVYNALEYAWDNNYSYIYVVEDAGYQGGRGVTDIIALMSADSPMLQQNVDYSVWETGMIFSEYIMGKMVEKDIPGTIVEIDNFTKTRTDKALAAVEEAKKIKLDFTEAKTDSEKARIIYDYVVENIEYYDDPKNESYVDDDHLYDALTQKKTICDGFSNAFALLCNMNGISCFEKTYNPEEEKNTEKTTEDATEDAPTDENNSADEDTGHTWCVVNFDGKWYNVDVTNVKNKDGEVDEIWSTYFFGFSDDLQFYENDYADILPKCEKSLFTNYIVVENYDDFVSTVGDAIIETENNKLYVGVNNFEYDNNDEYEDYLQDLVYYTNSSVYSQTKETEYMRIHHFTLK